MSGLLRQVAVDGSKTYFDTNVSQHHHFFVEGENDLLDIPHADVVVGKTPIPPEGYEIARIDVVVRLRKKAPLSPSFRLSAIVGARRMSRASGVFAASESAPATRGHLQAARLRACVVTRLSSLRQGPRDQCRSRENAP